MMNSNDQDRSRDRSRRDKGTRFSEPSRDRSTDRGRGSMKSSNNRVYVSNIPYEFRWQDLKDLFRTQVGDVQFVELFADDNDKPKGCGIVEFSDPNSVQKCLEVMQRYDVKGRKLVIKEDGTQRDKHGNVVGNRRGGREDRFRQDRFDNSGPFVQDNAIKFGNTYGLSPQFLESLNIDGPLCNRVFVANLDFKVDKKKLKEVFRLAGKVIGVELPVDKDGRSRGFAVVEFDHPVEAVQAISMLHNQPLYDRHIAVRMDRVNEALRLPEGLKGIGMGLGANGEPLKNVSLNLPNSNPSPPSNSIVGSVPTSALQVANALSSLNNPLGSLTNPTAVLQAANLTSLLSGGLGNSDLSLASNIVSNTSQNLSGGGNVRSNLSSNNIAPFSRSDDNYSDSQNSGNYGQSTNFGQSRGTFQNNYETQKPNVFSSGFGNGSNDGGNYGSVKKEQSMSGGYNRKVLVTNLPPLLSYKLLHEKFSEFGDVELLEEKGQGNLVIEFASEWQAEAAVKNLDRARIDGRLIGACLC